MKVKVKKLSDKAVMPEYQSNGAACFDLVAVDREVELLPTGPTFIYDTKLAFEIPEGYVGLLFPRSSVTKHTTLSLGNAVGVIDSDYRGSVSFMFRNTNNMVTKEYKVGDRVGQMMIIPVPAITLEETDELSITERGEGGFGSTNK